MNKSSFNLSCMKLRMRKHVCCVSAGFLLVNKDTLSGLNVDMFQICFGNVQF